MVTMGIKLIEKGALVVAMRIVWTKAFVIL